MAKRRSNYGATSSPEVETASSMVEVEATPEVVEESPPAPVEPVPAPVVEAPAPAPVAVEPAPVVVAPVEPKPVSVKKSETETPAVRVRFGARFKHPQYGEVQVVTVPVNGHCMVRVEATGKSVPYTVK